MQTHIFMIYIIVDTILFLERDMLYLQLTNMAVLGQEHTINRNSIQFMVTITVEVLDHRGFTEVTNCTCSLYNGIHA